MMTSTARCRTAIGYYQLNDAPCRAVVDGERLSQTGALATQPHGRLNTPTLKILVENRRAVGVEIGISSGIETLRAEREVILCSGAIGSPRLLQLSGIGPADALTTAGVPVVS